MGKKLRQVTDNIHETVYLSDLESELISTPYFYRLHDIYQSSTVYMTFPSNRTKRYEHSLGTMSLASRMLYSAVTNADNQTRKDFFSKLKHFGLEIANLVVKNPNNSYFAKDETRINDLFDNLPGFQGNPNYDELFLEYIRKTVAAGRFANFALDYYQYYPVDGLTSKIDNDIENLFFYRCLLQAIRIVALFHDVGHPPYSHIIEDTLFTLYQKISANGAKTTGEWNENKISTFRACLDPFFSPSAPKSYRSKRLFSQSSLVKAKPHERIGLSLLNMAIDAVVPKEIKSILDCSDTSINKVSQILYSIIVVEFAVAILVEKNIVFESFHKIVDGIVDADRLDYIVRDSKNSGVDWGTIPYERIVNSARLFKKTVSNHGERLASNKQPFVIAYPKKISDDIEDLLLVRYKIFARINFHHRCMKTAMALQASVKALAIDYLQKGENAINPDIATLWLALQERVGDKSIRIIQWNDSWLISVLHGALVKLSTESNLKENNRKLKEDLEEILLNQKKYYSLLKRGSDNVAFVKSVLDKAGITKEVVETISNREYLKLLSQIGQEITEDEILTSSKSNALDAINRLLDIRQTFDLDLLCQYIFPQSESVEAIVHEVLSACPKILAHAIIINKGKGKTGLPLHTDIFDNIYLYDGTSCFAYDEERTLLPQILSIQRTIPWLYVYYVPSSDGINSATLATDLLDLLSSRFAECLRKRFDELFPSMVL